ncbi:MAG: carbon monoxide dehydrogenase subunit G [Betaproteobacteria bacterium]|jgi:carbon monoxide dehydrogenase subunit G|nr:carbon monoxide dehydrogenase subunit G [Betaproteobacteria bacterium]MBK7654535.1 carbon monoxide dehydrogenase subunit G [Betaproteobacteria bacterium]MBP6644861.1 carbon monoxide dehydrogenase subunit G [Burkholderiaceae bacterium]
MDMQGSRHLNITQQQAWEALNDPAVLKACIPGCEKIELIEENRYAVGVAVKVGPVSAKFAGKISLTDMLPPHSYAINFDGQGGAAGFGKGAAQVVLTSKDDGCDLDYSVSAQVGGKIAQVGQRLIDGVAKSMAEDFFKRFDAEMERQYPSVDVADASNSVANSDAYADEKARKPSILSGWAWAAIAAGLLALYVYLM